MELLDPALNGVRVNWHSIIIEAVMSIWVGNAHSLTELIENGDFLSRLHSCPGKAYVGHGGAQVPYDLDVGPIGSPIHSRLRLVDLIEEIVNNAQSFIENQVRLIEREAISPALFFAVQRPQNKTVGCDNRHLSNTGALEFFPFQAFLEGVHQEWPAIDDLLEFSGSLAQNALNTMLSQTAPNFIIGFSQQVISDISQKVEMADIVRSIWKHLCDSIQNARTHIMNQSQGPAIELFDVPKERNDLVCSFRRQLHVFQYDFTDPVQSGHQVGTISITGGIKVQDIAPLSIHEVADPLPAFSVRQSQIDNELLGQIRDLRWGDRDMAPLQLQPDLGLGSTVNKSGNAYLH